MKIYTKTGDNGETSLFGGERVSKDHLRIEAYGTVDELNSVLGMLGNEFNDVDVKETVLKIQNDLFTLGADLATPLSKDSKVSVTRIGNDCIDWVEKKIDFFEEKLPALKSFILPGGTRSASILHFARTVSRRAERKVVTLSKNVDIGSHIIVYLNRLSDLFFVLSRYENFAVGTPDIKWKK